MASCGSTGKAENGRVIEVSGSTIRKHVRKSHVRHLPPKTPSFEARVQAFVNRNSESGGDGSLKTCSGTFSRANPSTDLGRMA
ncbi:MAG: hypothetical protein OXE94_11885 [Aestuariivita sp.]|nr:hypothetical protein [Aestuariivita sp.]MCY4203929.1 hypothetical protein [Aestuariivita sp.]